MSPVWTIWEIYTSLSLPHNPIDGKDPEKTSMFRVFALYTTPEPHKGAVHWKIELRSMCKTRIRIMLLSCKMSVFIR